MSSRAARAVAAAALTTSIVSGYSPTYALLASIAFATLMFLGGRAGALSALLWLSVGAATAMGDPAVVVARVAVFFAYLAALRLLELQVLPYAAAVAAASYAVFSLPIGYTWLPTGLVELVGFDEDRFFTVSKAIISITMVAAAAVIVRVVASMLLRRSSKPTTR